MNGNLNLEITKQKMKMNKKFRFIYKITLLCGSLKDHYYIGQHSTNNINDGYAGSGTKIAQYYKKYGKIEGETYIKQILSYHNTLDELNQAEYEAIGNKYEEDPLCINLAAGGDVCTPSDEVRKKISNKLKGRVFSEEWHQNMRIAYQKRRAEKPESFENCHGKPWKDKDPLRVEINRQNMIKYNKSEKHRQCVIEYNKTRVLSQETHQKMSDAQKGKTLSDDHKSKLSLVTLGRIWINNGVKLKRVHKPDLQKYIDEGWKVGKKF